MNDCGRIVCDTCDLAKARARVVELMAELTALAATLPYFRCRKCDTEIGGGVGAGCVVCEAVRARFRSARAVLAPDHVEVES